MARSRLLVPARLGAKCAPRRRARRGARGHGPRAAPAVARVGLRGERSATSALLRRGASAGSAAAATSAMARKEKWWCSGVPSAAKKPAELRVSGHIVAPGQRGEARGVPDPGGEAAVLGHVDGGEHAVKQRRYPVVVAAHGRHGRPVRLASRRRFPFCRRRRCHSPPGRRSGRRPSVRCRCMPIPAPTARRRRRRGTPGARSRVRASRSTLTASSVSSRIEAAPATLARSVGDSAGDLVQAGDCFRFLAERVSACPDPYPIRCSASTAGWPELGLEARPGRRGRPRAARTRARLRGARSGGQPWRPGRWRPTRRAAASAMPRRR